MQSIEFLILKQKNQLKVAEICKPKICLPVTRKCQADWTMLPIQVKLTLSICVKRIERWYDAMHQAILKIELARENICGTKCLKYRN